MAQAKIKHRTVSIKQADRLVMRAFNSKKRGVAAPKVPMLWGPPGIGKSEMVEGLARSGKLEIVPTAYLTKTVKGKKVPVLRFDPKTRKEEKVPVHNCPVTGDLIEYVKGSRTKVVDIRLPLMEPTDIRGIPFFNPTENTMKWAPSEEFPSEEEAARYDTVILFLDELPSAPQSVQAASYQLMLNRRVGTYTLPANVRVIVAGNRDGDGGVTFKMPTPLKNRMIHFEIEPDPDTWIEWAINNHVHADIIGYISYAKGDLFKFDPRSSERAFPTPRSWVFASDFLYEVGVSEDDLTELIAGTIGEGTTHSFMAQRKHSKDMPNPSDILSGKVKTLKSKEISAMFSLTVNLCRELQDASDKFGQKDPKQFHKMADYFFSYMMNNFGADMTVMGARTALFQYDLALDPTELKTFDEFHEKFGKAVSKAING